MVSTKVIKGVESNQTKAQIARLIGVSFVVMFFLGIFAEFVVRTQLINWEDPVLTYTNIQHALGLFNAGIFAFVIIILLDAILAIAFYVLLRDINRFIALLMVSLRLVYVAIKGAAMMGLVLARDMYATTIETNLIETQASQAMQFLKMHNFGFGIALFFIGFHLVFLALLLQKVSEMPKVIVWLLLAAGVGYSLNSMILLFVPDAGLLGSIIIAIFIIPMTFAELSFGIWIWAKRKNIVPQL